MDHVAHDFAVQGFAPFDEAEDDEDLDVFFAEEDIGGERNFVGAGDFDQADDAAAALLDGGLGRADHGADDGFIEGGGDDGDSCAHAADCGGGGGRGGGGGKRARGPPPQKKFSL